MERLFPRALLACIGEGRSPDLEELSAMADKIGREAFPHRFSADDRRKAINIARTALAGQQLSA
ncbi:hypothetical protein U1701_16285 [Sphingomonas sp. PB2P19]|uniref:hypothetical protein n=1 Tax=Sphingomonas rhamnosi TaxID=3096156 RepID=UPI002FCAE43B